MNDEDKTLVDAIQQILANVPGTLRDHQQRINSMEHIKARLAKLTELERLDTGTPAEGTSD